MNRRQFSPIQVECHDAVGAQLVRVEELVDRADDAAHLVVQRGELGVRAARLLERLAELALGPLRAVTSVIAPCTNSRPSEARSGRSRTHIQRSTPVPVADPVLVVDGTAGRAAAARPR